MTAVIHSYVSTVADDGNPNHVGSDEWNAGHTIDWAVAADLAATAPTASAGSSGKVADAAHVHVCGALPTFAAGYYYTVPFGLLSTATPTADQMVAMPFIVGGSTAFDRIAVKVSTSDATATVALAVYQDSNGLPGAQLLTTSELAVSSTGVVSASFTQSFSGKVWLVYRVTSPGTAEFVAFDQSVTANLPGMPLVDAGQGGLVVHKNSVTGTLPDPFGTPTGVSAIFAPALVCLRAA